MKKSIALVLISIIAIALLGSCATSMKTVNGKLGYGDISGENKGSFSAKGRVTYILHPSLVPITATNEKLDSIIDPALAAKGANAATNVEIKYGFDFVGFIVRYLTGGLVGLDYVSVTGNAIAH